MIDTKMMRFTFGHRDYDQVHYPLCEQNHINCAILALCNELDAEREKKRWIPVGERLPDVLQEELLAYYIDSFGDRNIASGCTYFGNLIFTDDDGYDLTDVSHWRTLPEPPEEQK